jgi:putative transposase
MKKGRFSEAQIVGILKELDGGTPATELARKHGVHANTIRMWRDRYGGLETSDLVRLKQLEAENSQMERIIARQTLELKVRPRRKRHVRYIRGAAIAPRIAAEPALVRRFHS